MFQVVNIHTVAELKFDARRVAGARNVLVFDRSFDASPELQVLKALLTRSFSVPRERTAAAEQPARHSLTFSWLDGRIWMRVYRIETNVLGALDVAEIGPRLVLLPTRIIASCFSGAILHEQRGQLPTASRATAPG